MWGGLRTEWLPALAAMLVAVPAAVANGLVMYAPLGPAWTAAGAMAGVVGSVALGLVAPPLGGTPRLVSAPSPAGAAFMAAFATHALANGAEPARVAERFVLVALVAGALQLLLGAFRGGRLVKYLPYPVVAGYLTGAGLLILHIQLPRALGVQGHVPSWEALLHPARWSGVALAVAAVTIAVTLAAPRLAPKIPATLVGLAAGALVYRAFAFANPSLMVLERNPLLVGPLPGAGHLSALTAGARGLSAVGLADLEAALLPGVTLAVLLSIDTLKTCLLVDLTTRSRHDSDRELLGQGLGNVASALAGGAPGTGIVSGTLVNVQGGAKGRGSGFLAGAYAAAVLLAFGWLVAYLPVPALAAIVCLMATRMFQREGLQLVRERRTLLDFAVVAAVIATAMTLNLAAAAGAGVALAVVLYVREQVQAPLVRREALGDVLFSKRRRLPAERRVLEARGGETAVIELQGSIFFGTADRLQRVLERHAAERRRVVLDLGHVRSVDLTAVNALKQSAARLAASGGQLALCDLPQGRAGERLAVYLAQLGVVGPDLRVRLFSQLDDALEWAEEELLAEALPGGQATSAPLALDEMELLAGLPPSARAALARHARERSVAQGEHVFGRGDGCVDLFFIRSGAVRITMPLGDGRAHALAKFGRGDCFGELAFVDGNRRSANAVADEETRLYALSPEELARAGQEHPELATLVHARIARTLATRLRAADVELHTLRSL
jgi:SulP family sulfate permease